MAYYIGIDGGGSKTECVIGDEERVREQPKYGFDDCFASGERVEQQRAETGRVVEFAD